MGGGAIIPLVAFDESGNSGANLFDPNQPVFVLSSVHLVDDAAAQLIGTRTGEIKFAKLRRSNGGRCRILDLLNSPLLRKERILLSAFHKPFMAMTKLVDLLIEPMFYESGIDVYERGMNISLANLLYFTMPVSIGRAQFDILQAAFVEMIRSPSVGNIDRFYGLVADTCQRLRHLSFVPYLKMLLATRWVAQEYMAEWDASDLDPAVPAFADHASTWTERLGTTFTIIHDSSKPLARERLVLEAMMSITDEQVQIGYDRRKKVFPIRATGIEFCDSFRHPQIQIADVLASSTAYCLRAMLRGGGDPFVQDLLRTHALSCSIHRVWPAMKFSPEDLGTTEVGGIDPNQYVGDYVARRLGGIPPKGKRW